MKERIDLVKNKNITKAIVLFSIPTFFLFLSTYLFYAVDIFILSASGAEEEIATVMSAVMPITLSIAFITGLGVGGTFLIGQYRGADEKDGVKNAIMSFALVMMIFSVLLAVIVASFSPLITDILNIQESLKPKATRYLLITCIALPFVGITYFISSTFRGLGYSTFPFVYTFTGIALNIIFDLVFVLGLGMRSDGAALSFVMSYVVSSLLAISYILIFRLKIKDIGKISISKKNVKRIIKYGAPLCLQEAMVTISLIVLVTMINSWGIPEASNVVTISDKITNICYAPVLALGNTVATAVAQNLGAYEVDRCRKIRKIATIVSLIGTAVVGLPIIFASREISGLYIHDAYVQEQVFYRCLIIAIDLILCSWLTPYNGVQSGSGHTVKAMLVYLVADVCVRIPLSVVLSYFHYDIWIITLSYPISTIFGLAMTYLFYRSKNWQNLKSLPVTQDVVDDLL